MVLVRQDSCFLAEYFQYIVIASLFIFLFVKSRRYIEMVALTIVSAIFQDLLLSKSFVGFGRGQGRLLITMLICS